MTAWVLVGVFATAAGLLAAFVWWQLREIVQLKAERDEMRRTAFEARGVAVVEANRPRQAAEYRPSNAMARLASKLVALEARHAKDAQDRDERLAAEIEEKNRLAAEWRKRNLPGKGDA